MGTTVAVGVAAASTAYGAYTSSQGSKDAASAIGRGTDSYNQTMSMALDAFMRGWAGKDKTLGSILSNPSDRKTFQSLTTLEDQNAFLSKKLGQDVTLDKQYTKGALDEYGRKLKLADITYSINGQKDTSASFEANQARRDEGGIVSKTNEYRPWIQPGEEAYTKLTNAIVNGDFTDFYTSPGYEWRKSEGEKSILQQANAGKLPTAGAEKALINYGQNAASTEYQNYLSNMEAVANKGYNAQSDLNSLEAYYKGAGLNAVSGLAAGNLNAIGSEASYIQQGANTQGKAIASIGEAIAPSVGTLASSFTKTKTKEP